jgi:hypothetical protein
MSDILKDILKVLPKWAAVVAFCVFVLFMVISPFFGNFKIAGYEFGFSSKSTLASYPVIGTVEKFDQKPVIDITISPRFPPLYPSGSGDIAGLEVWKGPDGRFPVLAFSHPDYQVEAIDLNDTDKVEEKDGKLRIKEKMILRPFPRGGP